MNIDALKCVKLKWKKIDLYTNKKVLGEILIFLITDKHDKIDKT